MYKQQKLAYGFQMQLCNKMFKIVSVPATGGNTEEGQCCTMTLLAMILVSHNTPLSTD